MMMYWVVLGAFLVAAYVVAHEMMDAKEAREKARGRMLYAVA